jgi:hypothetical protein
MQISRSHPAASLKKPAIFLILVVMVASGFYFNAKALLFPGPISGTSPRGQPLEGYPNHAAFEQECRHCHAPVHCITDRRCENCHKDVAQQRASGEGLHSLLPGTDRCQTCHFEHQGREVVITEFAFRNVDHFKLSGFSLALHQTGYDDQPLNCQSCHSQSRYLTETLDCLTCHVEAEHDLMAEHIDLYGLDCMACHDGLDRFSGWGHQDSYPLDGAHADLDCLDCHVEKQWAGLPRDCAGCHEELAVHLDIFGNDCQRCHTTSAWLPAFLTNHTFDLYHGSEELLECSTCHINNYTTNTCYECHDHQPDEMADIHEAEQIYEFDHCSECHPTGHNDEDRTLRETLSGQAPQSNAP